jgi:hypothetical protein
VRLVSSLTRSGSSKGQSDSVVSIPNANRDADLPRGTRLTVHAGRFQPLQVLQVEG